MADQTLKIKVQIDNVDASAQKVHNLGQSFNTTSSASDNATASLKLTEIPLLQLVSTAQSAVMAFGAFGLAITAFSGVGIAAKYQIMHQGFTTMTGSAEEATRLMERLREIGNNTRFPTEDVVHYAQSLMATGSSAQSVSSEIMTMADAMSAAGKSVTDLGQLSETMGRLRFMQGVDIETMASIAGMGINISKVVGAALGKQNLTQLQAEQTLSRYRGDRVYQILLDGMKKVYGGSAINMGQNSGIGAAMNLMDAFRESMLSTGNDLLIVLVPVMNAIKTLINWFTRLNESLGGGLGLIILIKLLWVGMQQTMNVIRNTKMATMELMDALLGLSGSMNASTAAATANAAAQSTSAAVNFGSGAAIGAGIIGGKIKNTTPAVGFIKRIGMWLEDLFYAIKSGGLVRFIKYAGEDIMDMLKGIKLTNPIILIVGFIGEYLMNWLKTLKNKFLHSVGVIGSPTIMGAGFGAVILGMIPVIGPLIGGIIGAILGMIKGIWDLFHEPGKAKQTDTTASQIASNTKQTAVLLRDIHAQMIGGGNRAGHASAISTTEIEIQMARMQAYGMG